jgi:hypothetical protein
MERGLFNYPRNTSAAATRALKRMPVHDMITLLFDLCFFIGTAEYRTRNAE